MRIEKAVRTLLGAAALCWLLTSAGCGGASTGSNSIVNNDSSGTAAERIDWGMPLLPSSGVGVGQFPAKFTFDVTATPDCTNDFVVYNTGGLTGGSSRLAGAAATVAASQTGTFNSSALPSGTVTITNDNGTAITLTASTTVNTGLDFQVSSAPGAPITDATDLVAAINRNNTGLGVTADNAGGTSATVTVTATTAGAEGNLIALGSSLSHFSWTAGSLASGVGAANIVAFNHLYSSQGGNCQGVLANGTGPQVYWSYFTGTGTASTSTVLSGDGTKVAFVENAAGAATLRILKWLPNQGTGSGYPVAPDTTLTGTPWSSCPADKSCIVSLAFHGSTQDTNSAPFYDYNTDTLYVGDNHGELHKFTNVFGTLNPGTAPAEQVDTACSATPCGTAGGGWPIQVNSATSTLTGPVYDGVSGNVYVGDSLGRLSMVREVGSNKGTCAASVNPPCLSQTNFNVRGTPGNGTTNAGSVVDAPIVDGSNGMVFAVNGTEIDHHGTILQAPTSLGSSVQFNIGGSGSGSALYGGAFDQVYFNSSPGSVQGHMYVCGKDNSFTDRPAVYQLSFTAATGVLSGVGSPQLGIVNGSGEACSPVTESFIPGATTDWIFFGVGNNANTAGNPIPATPATDNCRTGGGGACVISVTVGTGLLAGEKTWPPGVFTNAVAIPTNTTGGTSGIVIDNVVTGSTQANNVYFSLGGITAGAGTGLPNCNNVLVASGCAVRLTQLNLN